MLELLSYIIARWGQLIDFGADGDIYIYISMFMCFSRVVLVSLSEPPARRLGVYRLDSYLVLSRFFRVIHG